MEASVSVGREDIRLLIARLSGAIARGGEPALLQVSSASDLRLPLFLFFLSTELSRSFLPIFADSLYQPLWGWQHSIVVALPMTAYVFASVISTPVAGSLVDRFGTRKAFLAGMLPTIISLIGQGFSPSILILSGCRIVEGFGFALVSIAALDHIRQTTSTSSRAAGAVVYGAAYITAGICGTSIGGILADRAGFAGAMFIAATLAVVATQLSLGAFRDAVQPTAIKASFSWIHDLSPFEITAVPGSIGVAGLAGANWLITGFVYYTTPLLLHAEGFFHLDDPAAS